MLRDDWIERHRRLRIKGKRGSSMSESTSEAPDANPPEEEGRELLSTLHTVAIAGLSNSLERGNHRQGDVDMF